MKTFKSIFAMYLIINHIHFSILKTNAYLQESNINEWTVVGGIIKKCSIAKIGNNFKRIGIFAAIMDASTVCSCSMLVSIYTYF
jgi:hypothetical protein